MKELFVRMGYKPSYIKRNTQHPDNEDEFMDKFCDDSRK